MAIQFEPFECMMTHSTCYENTSKMDILGVLWHSTGANNDMLKRYVQPYEGDKDYDKKLAKLGVNKGKNDWNHIYKKAGLNNWIGKFADGSVGTVQAMPWNYRPWGCRCREYWNSKKQKYEYGPSCNDGWIQFEICEEYLIKNSKGQWVHYKDTPGDYEYATQVWNEAVRFTAWICQKYNLDPMGTVKKKDYYGKMIDVPVILDHRKSWELGFGSGHGDVEHWFKVVLGKTMDDARKEVKALIDADKDPTGYENGTTYQVVCSELNVRTAATTNSKVVRVAKKGDRFVCKSSTRESNRIWMRIEDGWVCCREDNDVYVTYVGWLKKDNAWYYYDSDGDLVTSEWVKTGGKWYYVGPAGAMLTGWHSIDGKDYYLYDTDGHMAKNEWIDGLWLGNDGAQTYPYKGEWKTNSKGKWWEDTSGYYPKAKTERINGKDYAFDAKGYLIGEK